MQVLNIYSISAYGSTIANVHKHRMTKFIKSKYRTLMHINDPAFRTCALLDDDIYEISKLRRRVNMKSCTQIGFKILQLAKLKILQIYWDWIFVHLNPGIVFIPRRFHFYKLASFLYAISEHFYWQMI